MSADPGLLDEIGAVLGDAGVLTGDQVSGRSAGIWRSDNIRADAIFRPASTEEVAAVMKACHQRGQRVVVHGGLTGLAEGAIAEPGDVVLSTERLNRIEQLDPVNRTLRLQAGVTLQAAQDAAEHAGLQLALDLGARGSCTVGGNAATNAGGINVLRYGMAREQILGLEVVLADGTIVSSLNEMLKNNAGYDLKQLFIGSEGTLGIITRLVFRLRSLPASQETALLACDSFAQVTRLLAALESGLDGSLHAFELMWQNYYQLVGGERPPLPGTHNYYVLAEARGSDASIDQERFVSVLQAALEDGCAEDALICKSDSERQTLWELREKVELTLESGSALIFDVSMPLGDMESYVADVQVALQQEWQGSAQLWVFGHAGDGNLHLVVAAGDNDAESRERIESCVYEPLRRVGGSVAAEHGIGLEKKAWLDLCRSPAELQLMQRMKAALDPQGILNPGRVIDAAVDE